MTLALRPLHVLHLVEAFGGGTLTAVSCLCHGARPGIRHSVAHGLRPETPVDFAKIFPSDTRFYPIGMQRPIHPVKDFFALRELISLLRVCKPDIVHCHSSKSGVLGRLAARFCSIPSIYTPHCYSFLRTDIGTAERRFYHAVEWCCSRIGDTVVACGDEEYALAHGLGCSRKDVRRIRNAVDYDALATIVPHAWPLQRPIAGICGRLTQQRTPELFFDLAERLRGELSWVWIGAGTREGVPDTVLTTEWLLREEALRGIAGFDIYVQTSSWEGLSYAILEAMALGKPVVARDIPSNRAVVEHGVTGFLGAATDDLAGFLLLLAHDPELRTTMGDAARKRIAEQYNAQTSYQSYVALCHDLAGRKNGEDRG